MDTITTASPRRGKMRPNLSLTAGLRYEVNTPFRDATNQLGNFRYQVPGGELVVNPNENISPAWEESVGNTPFVLASSVGLGPGMRHTYWDNIQPCLGFAWSPANSHDTVIRASAVTYSVPVLGHPFPEDLRSLVEAMGGTLLAMQVEMPNAAKV